MFRVGDARYSARVTDRPIVLNGVECDGLCDERGRRILIDPELPLNRRLWVLFHELAHAGVYAHGMPTTVEGLCDFIATLASLGIADLDAAGGVEALKRLSPGEELGLETAKIALTRSRYCPVCQGTVAAGSIECHREGAGHVKLSLGCDHCGIRATWRELATHGGLPSGVVVGEPEVIHGVA
jgi:hypothetical protein